MPFIFSVCNGLAQLCNNARHSPKRKETFPRTSVEPFFSEDLNFKFSFYCSFYKAVFFRKTKKLKNKNKKIPSFLKKYTLQSSVLHEEDNILKTSTKIHLHLQTLSTCGFNSTKIFVSGMIGVAGKKSAGFLLSYGFTAPKQGNVNRSLCFNTSTSLSKESRD